MTYLSLPVRAILLFAFFLVSSSSAYAQPVTFASSMDPIEVAGSDYGNTAIRMVLNASDEPVVSFGKSSHLYVAKWNSETQAFDPPVVIEPTQAIYLSDQEGPEMVAHGDLIVLTYSHNGDWVSGLRSVRSDDGGVSWSDPVEVSPQTTTELFLPCVAMDDDGNPFVGVIAGGVGEDKYEAAIQSLDGGQSWLSPVNSSELMDGDQVCECCPSSPFFTQGRYYNVIRNNNSNTRDFWLVGSPDGQSWNSALDVDPIDWVVSSCPASGATVAGPMSDGSHWLAFMNQDPVSSSSRVFLTQVDLQANDGAGEWLYTGNVSPDPSEAGIQNAPVMDVRNLGDGSPLAALVWEENVGGYDVQLSLALNDGSLLGAAPMNLTSAFSGHHKKPIVRLGSATAAVPYEIDVHLVWKDAQMGVVRYLKGVASGPDGIASENTDRPIRPSIAAVGAGGFTAVLPLAWRAGVWKIWDVTGKLLDSGSLNGDAQWNWASDAPRTARVIIVGIEPSEGVPGWAQKVALH